MFFILPRVYVFSVYSLDVSLAGCTPAGFYGLGSNTVKHAPIGMQTHTDTDTLEPQVLTHHTAWRGSIVSPLCALFFNALITEECMVYSSYFCPPTLSLSLTIRGHLPHLFVTIEQEHDSSKIRPMKSVCLMGQKMKTVMAVL